MARLQQIEGLPDPALGVSTWDALSYNGNQWVSTAGVARRTGLLGFGSHALPSCAQGRRATRSSWRAKTANILLGVGAYVCG
jgi:hypothetical protein